MKEFQKEKPFLYASTVILETYFQLLSMFKVLSFLFDDVNFITLRTKSNIAVRIRYLIISLLKMISDDKEEKAPIFSDEDITRTVDYAIKVMDKNFDGFIEFPEFAVGAKEYN